VRRQNPEGRTEQTKEPIAGDAEGTKKIRPPAQHAIAVARQNKTFTHYLDSHMGSQRSSETSVYRRCHEIPEFLAETLFMTLCELQP
jgi:hypothetical protein